ncbi:MAG TPA: HTTM domain-containing protein [Gemmatimonadaceae bacterium]|nr:HTTM domain-containing protein [Gemmatimonadaceae bacterium]
MTERINRPAPALPVDIFRILVGLLSAVYFLHLYVQVTDFSSPDGLIDHELIRQLFWYSKVGFFGPAMTADAFRIVFLFAFVGSLALVVGYRVRAISIALFLIAVSAYRWNFLVIYVDDAIMHLVLFWMILLPAGKTLVLSEWRRDGRSAIERWKHQRVPGGTVRCFLVNLALVYLVAGLWKWTSPMWRDGSALYAALRMPISYTPDFWTVSQLPMLRFANYGAMILEPLLPLMLILPPKHRMKWALFAGCVGFHLGIVATMRIPYANIACLAAAPIVFRHEIMSWLGQIRPCVGAPGDSAIRCWYTRSSIAFVTILVLAMAGEAAVPSWRNPSRKPNQQASVIITGTSRIAYASSIVTKESTVDGRVGFLKSEHNFFYTPLWFIGIAQSYRLFDWIDDRNFHTHYDITERLSDGSDRSIQAKELFPATLRGVLLQVYLHDITWGRVPRNRAAEFKASLSQRFANRYCRNHAGAGHIEAWTTLERTGINASMARTDPELLLEFSCRGGEASLEYPHPVATLASK